MRSLALLAMLCFSRFLFAQKAEEALERFSDSLPQEKVVLQFSKPEYLAGETISYKAYVLNGYQPSNLSTNLYAELYDKEKHLLDKEIVPLIKGSGEGSFTVPASLAEDVYYVRAYTQWMLNFPERFQYIKPLAIYNLYSSVSLRPKPVQWTARAFAEGDKLVEGTAANIAIRLFSNGSLPASWKGTLREKGSTDALADVRVFNNEIGQVRFVPEAGKTYQLQISDASGNQQEIVLPPPSATGIALQMNLTPSTLRYAILFKGIPSGGKGYKLVTAFNNRPAMTANITKANGEVSGSFNIKDFPAGVMQLTLFDEHETPVLERLCFLHQDDLHTIAPSLSLDTLSLLPKAHNQWMVAADSLTWESYAVEVADAAIPLADHFLSDVYLSSDFSTPISQPEWYFTDVNNEKLAALDALLLTEKWQRFEWSDVLQNRFPAVRFKPDNYLSFTGTVKKGNTPQALRTLNLLMRAADSSVGFLQVKTDNTGSFSLNNLVFSDTVKIYFQPEKRKLLERELDISFEPLNKFFPFNAALPPTELTVGPRAANETAPAAIKRAAEQKATELTLAEKSKMLEAVTVKAKARNVTQELDKKLTSSFFSGGDARVFDFINQDQTSATAYSNILEWLQGRVPGYSVAVSNGTVLPYIRRERVQVFLDEMPMDADMVGTIAPSEIAMVKVFTNNFVGTVGSSAAIAIYTRRDGMRQKFGIPTLHTAWIAGYRKVPALLEPDYSEEENKNVTDNRLVLFRRAFLKPVADTAKLPVSFYNNDSGKQFRLLVTGFTHEGNVVYSNTVIR